MPQSKIADQFVRKSRKPITATLHQGEKKVKQPANPALYPDSIIKDDAVFYFVICSQAICLWASKSI